MGGCYQAFNGEAIAAKNNEPRFKKMHTSLDRCEELSKRCRVLLNEISQDDKPKIIEECDT